MRWYHVSATRNRASIRAQGLNWTQMGSVPGVAGSRRPEVQGIFLSCDDAEVDFFVQLADEPVDVWGVDGLPEDVELIEDSTGFRYYPATIAAEHLVMLRKALTARPATRIQTAGTAYSSTLTISFDDGQTLSGDDAHEWVRSQNQSDQRDS